MTPISIPRSKAFAELVDVTNDMFYDVEDAAYLSWDVIGVAYGDFLLAFSTVALYSAFAGRLR